MTALLLAIAASATLALVLKLSESRDLERYSVTAINYVAAAGGAAIMSRDLDWSRIVAPDLGGAIAGSLRTGARVMPAYGPGWAAGWGVITGVLLFAGLITFQVAIRRHGVGLATAMAKLGVLVPMTLAIGLWGEHPAPVQWAGIALALGAIVLANWPGDGDRWRDAIRPALIVVLICVGLSEFSSKVFQQYGHGVDKPIFLTVGFGVAGLIAWIVVAARRRRFGLAELVVGVAVGVPNLYSIGSLVDALQVLPAAVVFPAFAAGSLLVVQVAGVFLFGERPDRRGWAAVGLTLVALVLINL